MGSIREPEEQYNKAFGSVITSKACRTQYSLRPQVRSPVMSGHLHISFTPNIKQVNLSSSARVRDLPGKIKGEKRISPCVGHCECFPPRGCASLRQSGPPKTHKTRAIEVQLYQYPEPRIKVKKRLTLLLILHRS